VHVYRVDNYPSQSGGLSPADVQLPYFGVFLASSGSGDGFQTNFDSPLSCPVYFRSDNSVANWAPGTSVFTHRVEIIKQLAGSSFIANLGSDEILCDVSFKSLTPVSDPSNKTFLWSTGATTPTLNVVASGTYWVTITQSCQVDRDTINLGFFKTPVEINLGEDRLVCDVSSVDLSVSNDFADVVEWNTGSSEATISVSSSGQYWVRVENTCGISRDTVVLTILQTPAPINLGADITACDGLDVEVSIPISNEDEVEWNTGSNQPAIHITESGQYWVEVRNACGSARDTVRLTSLFLDVNKVPNVITPNGDDKNEFFMVEKPLEGAYLVIFDRWGKKVYESQAYQSNWDGSELSSGVYFWRADGTCIKEAKGAISIVR
jgi:gliding motility-associated-like protein